MNSENNKKDVISEEIVNLKKDISKEKGVIQEIMLVMEGLKKSRDINERRVIFSQINELQRSLKAIGYGILEKIEEIQIPGEELKEENKKNETKSLNPKKQEIEQKKLIAKPVIFSKLENQTLKRIKKRERKVVVRKIKTPSKYVTLSSKLFSKISTSMINDKKFGDLKRDLAKANLEFTPSSYVSVMFFTTFLSLIFGIIIFFFFLFFNLGVELPIITKSTEVI